MTKYLAGQITSSCRTSRKLPWFHSKNALFSELLISLVLKTTNFESYRFDNIRCLFKKHVWKFY